MRPRVTNRPIIVSSGSCPSSRRALENIRDCYDAEDEEDKEDDSEDSIDHDDFAGPVIGGTKSITTDDMINELANSTKGSDTESQDSESTLEASYCTPETDRGFEQIDIKDLKQPSSTESAEVAESKIRALNTWETLYGALKTFELFTMRNGHKPLANQSSNAETTDEV